MSSSLFSMASYRELLSSSTFLMPGPRPSYGAVGQPVLPPPRQQPTNLAELDAIPYLPPAKLQQCATLAGMGATRAQLAAYFRPRVTAASSPWNDAVEQGFYDSMRLIHAHLSLNDLASLAMEMQDRDRTASVLRWIDEIDSLESVSPRWSTGSTVATKFDSEANWRTTPESSLSSPPPPPAVPTNTPCPPVTDHRAIFRAHLQREDDYKELWMGKSDREVKREIADLQMKARDGNCIVSQQRLSWLQQHLEGRLTVRRDQQRSQGQFTKGRRWR